INEAPIVLPDRHQGVIDRKTWDAVQAKTQSRKRGRRKTRAGGLPLTGLAYCGHCGWRMYGERHRIHSYLTCSGDRARPGTCRKKSVREDKRVRVLVRKIQEVYFAPERLEGLRRALRDRIEQRSAGNPERVEHLRRRLAALDGDIQQGARNLVRAGDNF